MGRASTVNTGCCGPVLRESTGNLQTFEEAFIDRGLTNSDVLRLLERAEERAKWKQ
jgi:hypothetical protein